MNTFYILAGIALVVTSTAILGFGLYWGKGRA